MLMIRPLRALSIGPGHRLDRVERAEEIGLQDIAPIVHRHAHDQIVARDARVVDQDVDLPERVERLLDQRLGCREVTDVGLHGDRLPAEPLDDGFRLVGCGGIAAVAERDVGSLLREPLSRSRGPGHAIRR